MGTMSLRACASCMRHVRHEEHDCPFCGSHLALAQEPRIPDVSRLSRAARLALGAALAAVALPGCNKEGNTQAPDDSNIAQPYGVPPDPEPAVTDAGAGDSGGELVTPVPAYGAPPPVPDD